MELQRQTNPYNALESLPEDELSAQTNLSDFTFTLLIQGLSQTVYLQSVASRGHRRMICRGSEYRHWFNWKALLCVRILKNFADSIHR